MSEKIKILHYVPGFDHGGIESRLIDWYKNIDREKIQFELLKLTTDDNMPLIKEFKSLGGVVHTLPKYSPKLYYKFHKELNEFFKLNHDYKMVHCHSPTTGKYIINKAKKFNIPFRIMHSRTTQFNADSSFLAIRNFLKKSSYKNATDYFACSKEAGVWLFGEENVKKNNVKIINNGIEVEQFLFNKRIRDELRKKYKLEGDFVIGNIGRFSSQKNHLFMIDIFNEIYKSHKNAKLMLVGNGTEMETVKEKVKNLKLDKNVLFLGRKENIQDYLQCMDVFLFPSHFEGFGTVAIESQAAGLVTIVSDGVPNSVDITENIYRLKLNSNAQQWAKKILEYSNGYERKNMLDIITEKGFDVKSTVDFLENYYIGNEI